MRLAFPQPVLVPRPAPVTSGLDQRVLALVVGLAVAASAGLIATSHDIVATLYDEPLRVATLLALTLALQLFSVQVYGRGSVSVSAIGILATAFVFDTGTTMAVAVAAAFVQWVRRRPELYKAIFDAANFALAGAAASLIFEALDGNRLLAAVVAGAAFAVINNGLLCLVMSFAEQTPVSKIWFERFHWARFHFAVFGAVALAATIAYEQLGGAGVAAVALPAALMILSVRQ